MNVSILTNLSRYFIASSSKAIAQDKSKLTVSKKLVVAGLVDAAEITVKLFDDAGTPWVAQKVKINVETVIGAKKIIYPKEVYTDSRGVAVFTVKSADSGFAEFWGSVENAPISDRTCLEFVPNVLFRSKQKENIQHIVLDKNNPKMSEASNVLRNYYLLTYQNPLQQLYKNSNSYTQWQSKYRYPWGPVELNIIDGQIGKYKGIVVHHLEKEMSVREMESWAYEDFLSKSRKFVYAGLQVKSFLHNKPKFDYWQKILNATYQEYDLKFRDFPYNFYIGSPGNGDGQVYELRTLEKRPAHVGRNTGVSIVDKEMIGVGLPGNYQYRELSLLQKNNLKSLIVTLAYLYKMDFSKNYPEGSACLNDPKVMEFKSVETGKPFSWLTGHRSFKDKICPGNKAMRWLNQERPKIIEELNKLRAED